MSSESGESRNTMFPRERAQRMFTIVEAIARRVARRVPAHIEIAELIGAGSVGLAEAYQRRGTMPGPEFEAFARRRIQGAMLDELRRQDPLSRGLRKLARALDRAMQESANAGASFSEEEAVTSLGIAKSRQSALQRRRAAERTVRDMTDDVADSMAPTPEDIVESKQLMEHALETTRRLPDAMQFVLREKYEHGRSQRDVAKLLGVTEARVSQIHSEATKMLGDMLRAPALPKVA